jgi:hypothetical protein
LESEKVYLVQTDTTVGFLSSDPMALSIIKKRDPSQKILQGVDSFRTLQTKVRVPKQFKKMVRNAKRSTFIYPNGDSYRVVQRDNKHQNFLKKFGSLYSTSANETKQKFNDEYAKNHAEILVYNDDQFKEMSGSSIYKINKLKLKKIR